MLDIDDLSVAEVEEILLQNLGRQITGQLGVGAHGIVREVREKCRQELPKHIVVEAIGPHPPAAWFSSISRPTTVFTPYLRIGPFG